MAEERKIAREPKSELALLIKGEGLNFDEISQKLALAATDTLRAGELLVRIPSMRTSLDEWTYAVELKNSINVDHTMSELFEHLLGKKDILHALQEHCEIVLRLYVRSDYASIFYRLMPENLLRLSQLGMPLEVSVLSWGQVSLD